MADMDDYDIEPTPSDSDFDPEGCESTHALWAVKEGGEPVKFLEASLVENPDYPCGYSFSWRTVSLCDRTGKLVVGDGGDIGDVSRADYVADMVLPGGAVFSPIEDGNMPLLPYSFQEGRLSDIARKSAAEKIRGAILALPLSAPETVEAIPPFYRLSATATPGDSFTRDMLSDALRSVENYLRDGAIETLPGNWDGMSVAKQALAVAAAERMQTSGELFDSMSRAIGLIRATDARASGVGDYALAQNLLITGLRHMKDRCFDTVSRDVADVRFMDTPKVVKAFTEELGRDTGLALEKAIKGNHAERYSRDADALIFTEADINDFADLIDIDCPETDGRQRREIASQALREWNDGHAMDGFCDFLHEYAERHAPEAAVKQAAGVRH